MLEELRNASQLLHLTLKRYLRVCSSLQYQCLREIPPRMLPPGYATQVERELNLIELYDTQLQQAKLVIKTTRNYAFNNAPINHLPTEILTRIFYMVLDSDPCHMDRLALVCSHWRSVAFSSPLLWSHIDYHPDSSKWSYLEHCARARHYVVHSGQSPLDVHISVVQEMYHPYHTPVRSMCEILGPRMRSLELNFVEGEANVLGRDNSTHHVITDILSCCTSGMLTMLSTTESEFFSFLTTRQDAPPAGWRSLKLEIDRSDLEVVFASITVLHLCGVFPVWTSQAYHGLVDLRLFTSDGTSGSIPEPQLINILKASPRLRIFHFELHISDRTEGDISASRVPLTELELLQVYSGHYDFDNYPLEKIEAILRLLAPGPRPLQLVMWSFDVFDLPEWEETRAFLARSTISKLFINGIGKPSRVLSSIPFLKVLVLSHCWDLGQLQPLASTGGHVSPSTTYPRFDVCIITKCELEMGELMLFIRKCQVRTLMIYGSTFCRDDIQATRVEMITVLGELLALCPDVRVLGEYPRFDGNLDLLR